MTELDELSAELAGEIQERQAQGESWSVYVEKIDDGSYALAGDGRQEAGEPDQIVCCRNSI